MTEIDEYILQRFLSRRTGRKETNLAYRCRLFWIRNNYPTFKEVASACGTTSGNVKNYCDYYGWQKIRDHITNLQEKQKQEEYNQYQEDTLDSLQNINKQRSGVLIYRLNFLLKEVGSDGKNAQNPELSEKQISKYWEEIYSIIRLLSQIQKDRLRDAGLPEKINDKLPLEADVKTLGVLELNQRKSKEELDKEYEDTIKKYISERSS